MQTRRSAQQATVGGFAVSDEGDEEPDERREGRIRRRDHRRPSRDDDDGSSDTQATRRATDGRRPPWRTIFEIFAGIHIQQRTFAFVDPKEPSNPPTYNSGIHSALTFDGSIYPFAAFSKTVLADIGIVGHYDRVVGLQSAIDGEIAGTLSQSFDVSLRYRWNILNRNTSPVLMAGLGYGRQMFFILSKKHLLPNITYDYLRLSLVHAAWPFFHRGAWQFGVTASFDYLLVLSAGEIENNETGSYGNSSTTAIYTEGGFLGSYRGFTLKALFFYRRYGLDFDELCSKLGNSCSQAGGALETYLGTTISVGYVY
ncbi:MAG: hypothetical protein KAI47_26675 [Deltaproteobacteria bacterium]|nr:hypothetical protein [Deltaproteobacteria bacterium]